MIHHIKETLRELDGLFQVLSYLSLGALLLWGMLAGQARSVNERYAYSLQPEAENGLVIL